MQAMFRGNSARKKTAELRGDLAFGGIQFSSRAPGLDMQGGTSVSDDAPASDDDDVRVDHNVEDHEHEHECVGEVLHADEAGIVKTQALFRGKLARKKVAEMKTRGSFETATNRHGNASSGSLSSPSAAQRLGAMLGTLLASTMQQAQQLDSSFASIPGQDFLGKLCGCLPC